MLLLSGVLAVGAGTRHSACANPWNLCWAEARIKIARMTLTIKLDRNWSSFQLANSTPPLSVTDSAIAPSARIHPLAQLHLSSRFRHRPLQAPGTPHPLEGTVPQQPDPNSNRPSYFTSVHRSHRRRRPSVALSIPPSLPAQRCVRSHRRGGECCLPPHMLVRVLVVLRGCSLGLLHPSKIQEVTLMHPIHGNL